ncbi:hypothetical protein D3C76_1683050 [compost metagenome]
MREVIADLVEHGVELDIGAFVDARVIGTEHRGAAERLGVETLTTVEIACSGAAGQAFLPVVHTGFEKRRTRHRRGPVGQEVARQQLAIGQHGEAGM